MNRSRHHHESAPLPEFIRSPLFSSDAVCLAEVQCRGACRHRGAEEHTAEAQLVFPYRGLFVRHVGSDASVADANQVLFFDADDVHRVSHPVAGGDACFVMTLSPPVLSELATKEIYDGRARRFRVRSRSLGSAAQALRNALLNRLISNTSTTLEAESVSLALATLAFSKLPVMPNRPTRSKRLMIDRVKLLLAESTSRRIGLAEIGRQVGASPVYLTQVFSQLEGLPLYRYHLRLRLAEALARLPEQHDLSRLALDLGFSSHSQFTTLFGQTYGLPPSTFLQETSRADVRGLLKILKAMPSTT